MESYFLFKQYKTIDNTIKITTNPINILFSPVCGSDIFAVDLSFSSFLFSVFVGVSFGYSVVGCFVSSFLSVSSVGFVGNSVSVKLSQLNFEFP